MINTSAMFNLIAYKLDKKEPILIQFHCFQNLTSFCYSGLNWNDVGGVMDDGGS